MENLECDEKKNKYAIKSCNYMSMLPAILFRSTIQGSRFILSLSLFVYICTIEMKGTKAQIDKQTHKTTTVTLAAHARRGLITLPHLPYGFSNLVNMFTLIEVYLNKVLIVWALVQ